MGFAPRSRPAVTVGLPVFNSAGSLKASAESILGQTHEDLELIISDNASTDETWDVCLALAREDDRVRTFRHPRNLGIAENWNSVVRAARGDFFKWASASDICKPTFIGACLELLHRDPGAVLAFSEAEHFDLQGSLIGTSNRSAPIVEERAFERFIRAVATIGTNDEQYGLIRTASLLATRLERAYPHGDLVLMAELAVHGRFLMTKERLLLRRSDPKSWTPLMDPAELKEAFWPGRPPRAPMLTWRMHIDYLRVALGSRGGARDRFYMTRYALQRAYWQSSQLRQELVEALRLPRPSR